MWGGGWKIYPEDIFLEFFLGTSNVYKRFCYLEEYLEPPHPYPNPNIKVKEYTEQGAKITGTYYSGKQDPTKSHKREG